MGVGMEKPVFNPEFFRELAQDNPLGMDLTPEIAEAWWHYVAWPRYKTYRYRSHRRAVTKWWASVSKADLDCAQSAIDHARDAKAARAQRDLFAHGAPTPSSAAIAGAIAGMFGPRP